jgi:alpha-amylase/alpha-mannosidase (GH57 family)
MGLPAKNTSLSTTEQMHLVNYTEEQLEKAFDYMFLAEGSDWFWWYGSDQSSGNDDYFGSAFRNLLKNVYTSLGQEPPAYLRYPNYLSCCSIV